MDTQWLKDAVAKLQDSVGEIEKTLVAQHVTLQDHVRRSEINEAGLEQLRAEVKPIAVHVAVVGALGKIIGVLGTLTGIALGISKLLGH